MIHLTLRELRSHKRRLFGTGLAVILGVAFLAATLVLGDTMRQSFKGVFAEANAGTDLIVRSSAGIGGGGDSEQFQRGSTDTAMVVRIGQLPEVESTVAEFEGTAQVLGVDGTPLGGGGPPTVGTNWITEPELNPFDIVEGRAPTRSGEVVIDAKTAAEGDLGVGDRTSVKTPDVQSVTVVGIARFGDQSSLGGTTLAAFDDATAQALFASPGQASEIRVHASEGVSPAQLRDAVTPVLDETSEALTGDELSAEQQRDIEGDFLGFVETMLLAFAGVALVVATFSIYNTFTIQVAQRSRQSALLRALGASRRQVLTAVTLEAVVVGAVASMVGIAVGLGLALGLKALLGGAGLELAVSGVVVSASAVAVSAVVGIAVTTLASVMPAIRASRVPPVAALREVSLDTAAGSRSRAATGIVVTIVGVGLVGIAAADGSMSAMGLGSLLTLVGAIVLGPVVARPVAGALGWPAAKLRGSTGRIARQNVVRNPRRTASSATALLVGVAVVTLFTILGASLKTSISQTVERSFGGDLVVDSGFGTVGLSPEIADKVAQLPEVATSVSMADAVVTFDGRDTFPVVADPGSLAKVLDLDVAQGSLADVLPGQVAVSQGYADDNDLHLGDVIDAGFTDGSRQDLAVGAVYRQDDLVSNVIITPQDWVPHTDTLSDTVVLIDLADGVSLGEGETAVQAVVDRHHGPDVQTSDEFVDSVAGEVDQALILVYGLLGLAVLIALMGIANTLSLAVHERTRELGLLRAVGQTRHQVRSTVRWESVVVAVFGTLGGLVIGSFLGWGLVRALAEEGFDAFTIPVWPVVTIVVLAAAAGVVAAIRPARRGARLDILSALAAE